ncbi:MAG: flagellar M-ring protein FliF C-terminal domain-containing protein [Planctomycetota bacterium]
MDRFQQILRTIGEQLGKLSPTLRLLIASTAVILVMALAMVALYAGSPDHAEIYQGADAGVKQRAAAALRGSGINARIDEQGRLLVPPDDAALAVGVLAEGGVLPADGTILFGNLNEHMSWTNPREMNQQFRQMALQGELERTIANFPSMRSARVFLDNPEPVGIGMAARSPTASISVMTADGTAVTQAQVDAVARLVSKAVSGLRLADISVIDAANSRYLSPRSDSDTVATSYLEHQSKVEQQFERKVRNLLAHIPGVTVAVTAEVDVKKVSSRREQYLPVDRGSVQAISEEQTTDEVQRSANNAAQPGVRPNTGADINSGPSSDPEVELADSNTRFETRFGSEVTNTVDPRGMPTQMSVSIQVPRSYIASLLTAAAGEGEPEGEQAAPDEAAIEQRFQAERSAIASLVQPHLPASVADDGTVTRAGEVAIGLMATDPPSILLASGASGGGGGGGLGFMSSGGAGGALGIGGGLIERGVLLALAAVAVGMMLVMVRKATRKVEMPSAEEIVGIPPALDSIGEVVGEADESQTPMEGIEVNIDDVQASKTLSQVADLVAERPDIAGRLLSRWVDPEQ